MSDHKKDEARRHVERLRGFYQQLTSYVVINILLIIVNFISNPHHLWFYWITLFWGVALGLQALRIFGPGGRYNQQWEEKKIKEYMDSQKDD